MEAAMRFYLVDRILEVETKKRLVAVKCVSRHDPVLEEYPSVGPYLAHTLAVESLAQASAWLLLLTTDFAQRGILGGFRRIGFGKPAPVGSRLDVVSEVDDWSEDAVMFNCRASCCGETVVEVDGALCLLVDAGTLEDPQQTRRHHQMLCLDGAEEKEGDVAAAPGSAAASDLLPASEWSPYDVVEEMAPGEGAAARKAIAMTDPVFGTHFPQFPIVPGVLLIQSIVELGRALLAAGGQADVPWRVDAIQSIRYRRYVRPGDLLRLRVEVAKQAEGEAWLSGRADVLGEPAVTMRRIAFRREQPA
jgi:3-hydroxyacyl-[acyl-carrier-protein] dehydratase